MLTPEQIREHSNRVINGGGHSTLALESLDEICYSHEQLRALYAAESSARLECYQENERLREQIASLTGDGERLTREMEHANAVCDSFQSSLHTREYELRKAEAERDACRTRAERAEQALTAIRDAYDALPTFDDHDQLMTFANDVEVALTLAQEPR